MATAQAAPTYIHDTNSTWEVVGNTLYLTSVRAGDISTSDYRENVSGYDYIAVKGPINEADYQKIGQYPYQISRADFSEATFAGTYTPAQSIKQLILPKGSTIPDDPLDCFAATDGNKYVAVPSSDYSSTADAYESVIVAFPTHDYQPVDLSSWKSDPVILKANTIKILPLVEKTGVTTTITQDQIDAWASELGKTVQLSNDHSGGGGGGGDTPVIGGTVTLEANNGNLAELIAGIGEDCPGYLIINGSMNADDVAALKNISCAQHVIMNNVALTNDAKLADFSFAGNESLQSVVLPKDLPAVKEEWFNGCTNMGTALSYSSDGTSLKFHSMSEGSLQQAINTIKQTTPDGDNFVSFTGNPYTLSNLSEVIVSGYVNATDMNTNGGSLNKGDSPANPIRHYDYTNATLSSPDLLIHTYDTDLEQIELPSNLTSIPDMCFRSCTSLKYIYIPNTVTTIGEEAFGYCESLEKAEFQEGITTLNFGANVFMQCTGMKHIVLPEGVKNIGPSMFARCTALESLRLPNSLELIDESAFFMCYALSYLTIPQNVKEIRSKAFDEAGIKDLYLMATTPCELPKIYSDTFSNNSFNGNNNSPKFIENDAAKLSFDKHIRKLIERGKFDLTLEEYESLLATSQAFSNGSVVEVDKAAFSHLTSEEMEAVYREAVSKGASSSGPGNTIVFLHYIKSESMENFLNGNPWKGQDNPFSSWGTPYYEQLYDGGTKVYDRLQNEKDLLKTVDHINDSYGFGPDMFGRRWPDQNHSDYLVRNAYADPTNAINSDIQETFGDCITTTYPSQITWRKFAMQQGFSNDNTDDVFTKLYDDTWYTMCFPFDLTDEQLEGAFNPNYNICEFNGAAIETTQEEIDGENYEVDNLVLLFTNIADTYYRDKYGQVYDRRKVKKTITIDGKEVEYSEKQYIKSELTKLPNGSLVLTHVPGADWLTPDNAGDDYDIYESIRGILAQAGHPYMIHPQKVEDLQGNPTQCVINHIEYKFEYNNLKKKAEATGATQEDIDNFQAAKAQLEGLYNDEAVTRKLSRIKEGSIAEGTEGNYDVVNMAAGKVYLEPVTDAGTYSFKGTFKPSGEEELIPYGAYFLAIDPNGNAITKKYPQFYRETGPADRNTGYWRQYTGIIQPDDAAQAWEMEHLVGPYQSSNAFSMGFGDFELTDATEIEQIVEDARKNDVPVKYLNVIVNINGQVVREGLDMTGLPRGIYIVGGKKYMVK